MVRNLHYRLPLDMENERRAKSRYPLRVNVRYQTLEMAGRVAGVGQTLNLSSSGALIHAISTIREGARVRVVFEWPTLLNGTIPLQLVTIGTVVRRQGSALAIAFEGYQFRTAGRANVATMPEPRVSPSYASADFTTLRMSAKSSS
jgi:hypothetical protein